MILSHKHVWTTGESADGWYWGYCNGHKGLVPGNHVSPSVRLFVSPSVRLFVNTAACVCMSKQLLVSVCQNNSVLAACQRSPLKSYCPFCSMFSGWTLCASAEFAHLAMQVQIVHRSHMQQHAAKDQSTGLRASVCACDFGVGGCGFRDNLPLAMCVFASPVNRP